MRVASLLLAVLLFGTAASARGDEVPPEPLVQNVTDPCPTYDDCVVSRYYQGDYGTGGLIPQACKQAACRTCTTDTRRCVSVALDASCTCVDLPVEGAGPHITYCGDMAGSCLYKVY